MRRDVRGGDECHSSLTLLPHLRSASSGTLPHAPAPPPVNVNLPRPTPSHECPGGGGATPARAMPVSEQQPVLLPQILDQGAGDVGAATGAEGGLPEEPRPRERGMAGPIQRHPEPLARVLLSRRVPGMVIILAPPGGSGSGGGVAFFVTGHKKYKGPSWESGSCSEQDNVVTVSDDSEWHRMALNDVGNVASTGLCASHVCFCITPPPIVHVRAECCPKRPVLGHFFCDQIS